MNRSSFSFSNTEMAMLDRMAKRTGITKTEIMRRLIRAYDDGAKIPGLPEYKAPAPSR